MQGSETNKLAICEQLKNPVTRLTTERISKIDIVK